MTVVMAPTEMDGWPALVTRAAAGDEAAFTHIVAAHHADMLRIAHVMCGDVEIAADAAQAAWAIAWRKLGSLRDPERLRPWLMSVAANEARGMVRRGARTQVREIIVLDPISSILDSNVAARLDLSDALDRLDPRDRILLALRYVAGLDSNEIGREVGMSATAVRSRLKRAIVRLRRDLDHG
jgi:RNA polymerase sigma-70 factor (ECF subfamily)